MSRWLSQCRFYMFFFLLWLSIQPTKFDERYFSFLLPRFFFAGYRNIGKYYACFRLKIILSLSLYSCNLYQNFIFSISPSKHSYIITHRIVEPHVYIIDSKMLRKHDTNDTKATTYEAYDVQNQRKQNIYATHNTWCHVRLWAACCRNN